MNRIARSLAAIVPSILLLCIATLTDADASNSTEQRQITVSSIEARGLVLGFGGVTPAQIEAGVRVLAEVLEQQTRASSGEARRSD